MSTITLPGLIDIHVHLRDPGQTEKEDFETGTLAALAGGFTTVCDMPNNRKPIFTYEALMEKKKIAQEKSKCTVLFYFGTTGDNLNEFDKVYDEVVGLKIYLDHTTGGYILNPNYLMDIYSKWNGGPILAHCEDEHIETLLTIAKQTSKPTHICHIHSKHVLTKIMQAKKEGVPVTCGITPHHLFLADTDFARIGPFAKMKPPLAPQSEVDFFWKNLDAVDVVESDHAPHTKEEKMSDNPPYGVPGLETTLPLLLTAVYEKKITMQDIVRLCYDRPREILSLPESAQHVVIDTEYDYIIKGEDMVGKCKWTPFEGRKVRGKVLRVSDN